jgi:hypothetical protein
VKRPALVIAQDPGRRQQLVASLGRGGIDATPAATATAADARGRLLVVAVDDLAQQAQGVPVREAGRAIVVARRGTLADVVDAVQPAPAAHVLVGDDPLVDADLERTARKLATGDIFGIEKYVAADADVGHLRLDDWDGRTRAIEAAASAAEAAGLRRHVRQAISQVCEELLMNALYDAPVDDRGRAMFAEVSPHERVHMRSPRPVSIRFAHDDTGFAIAVRDRFGRLAKNTVASYLAKCLRAAPGEQIDRKLTGAGLGLYVVASSAASLVINVAHDVATEVVCRFDRVGRVPLRELGLYLQGGAGAPDVLGPTPATANATRPITEPVAMLAPEEVLAEPGAAPAAIAEERPRG